MICPTCQGKPQHPPCQECGGSGFSHCCDGPPEQPSLRGPLIGHCACGSVLSAVTGECVRGTHCPMAYSAVKCIIYCRVWRTKARYVDQLSDIGLEIS